LSLLAKIVRDLLVADSNYSTNLPGGITPETYPQGGVMPYAVYQGVDLQGNYFLDGTLAYSTERITITVVALTRASCQTISQWIRQIILTNATQNTLSGFTVFSLRFEDQGDQAESFADATDDQARSTTIDIIGNYKET
jgi:Protein of unknown function (DUF3168)